jgi:hypothetical protein
VLGTLFSRSILLQAPGLDGYGALEGELAKLLGSNNGVDSESWPVENEERLVRVLILQLSVARVQLLDDLEHVGGIDLDDKVGHHGPFLLGDSIIWDVFIAKDLKPLFKGP